MTKIGRRGFLGMAAAAPIAAPKALQSIGGSTGATGPVPVRWLEDEPVPVDEKGYIRERIADLRKRREKGAYDESTPPDSSPVIYENIDSLRSVSPAYKEIMKEDARRRHNERSFVWHIDRELNGLMERARILGIPIF